MILEHVAVWTRNAEQMKDYYVKYFGGRAGKHYVNELTGFQSYFLSFGSGARLEIMMKESIPVNKNDTVKDQHLGLIHIAFGMETAEEVDRKADEIRAAGYTILRGPRITGDGYYEFETLDPDNNRLEVSTVFKG